MTATQATMTDLSSNNSSFLSTSADEPEVNSINFRESLRFFQEQLVINGGSSSSLSPSLVANESPSKYALRFLNCQSNKSDTLDNSRNNVRHDEGNPPVKSGKIPPIPTVDTILESVRVLRAIQKSQEQRGSVWTLDVASTTVDSDPESQLLNSMKALENEVQNGFICSGSLLNLEREIKTNTCLIKDINIDTLNIVQPDIELSEIKKETNIINAVTLKRATSVDSTNSTCPFWPSNVIPIEKDDIEKNKSSFINSSEEYICNPNFNNVAINKVENSDVNLTESSNLKSSVSVEQSYESILSKSPSSFHLENGTSEISHQINKVSENKTINNVNYSDVNCNLNGSNYYLENDLEPNLKQNSFALDQNILSEDVSIEESKRNVNSLSCSVQNDLGQTLFQNQNLLVEEVNYDKLQCNLKGLNLSFQNDLGYNVQEKIPVENQNHLNDGSILATSLNITEDMCNDLSFYGHESNGTIMIIKSESSSLRKDENMHGSVDCDSGLGTEKSTSSLSPTHQTESGRDSWSDTSSSHYVSAECSPCASLSSVFETPIGINDDISPKSRNIVETEDTKQVRRDICTTEPSDTCADDDFLKGYRLCNSLYDNDAEFSEASPYSSIGTGDESESVAGEQNNNAAVNKTEMVDRISKLETSSSPEERTQAENAVSGVQLRSVSRMSSNNSNNSMELDSNCTYSSFSSIDLAPQSPSIPDTDVENVVSDKDETSAFQAEGINHVATLEISLISNTEPEKEQTENGISSEQVILCEKQVEVSENSREKLKDCIQQAAESIGPTDSADSSDSDSKEGAEISKMKSKTTSSFNTPSLLESLYKIKECPSFKGFNLPVGKTEGKVYVIGNEAFSEPEGIYYAMLDGNSLKIYKPENDLCIFELLLTNGKISTLDKTTLKIESKQGSGVMIKLSSAEETEEWKMSLYHHLHFHLETEILDKINYPMKYHKNIVIVDLGSCSTRAGILMDQPMLPSVFFPTICATDKSTSEKVYGMEAFHSHTRQTSNLTFPVRPSSKIMKYTMDIGSLKGLFEKVFMDLRVDPQNYIVQISVPRTLTVQTQVALLDLLLNRLKVKAVNLTRQAILTLYAYDASTGLVVDIGDRMDIVPVIDGFMVETGVTSLPYGGQRLIHHFKHALAEAHLSLSNDVGSFIVQYIIENTAYIANDYKSEEELFRKEPHKITKSVELQHFLNEDPVEQSVTLDDSRYKVPEGLFEPDRWGLDIPGIHKLVEKAIQACGLDVRKQIAENIYVSGGVTLLPGFPERLQMEVAKLYKKSKPHVHASKHRYHASYIGACKFAAMEAFETACVDAATFDKGNIESLKKFLL